MRHTTRRVTETKDAVIVRDPEIKQIIVPESMSMDDAIRWLHRKVEEENAEVNIHHTIACFPLDGAQALQKAISERYGWSGLVPTPGFFGDSPPHMVSCEAGWGKRVQVPWGRMEIPGISGWS
jgi:transitional endoplasmic reticulum ATPase